MMTDDTTQSQSQKLIQEIRRGVIVLAVMSQLHEEQYGYSLMKRLKTLGMQVDQGTLYPLLRRLEDQSLLDSIWRVETSRPRRYYKLNSYGEKILDEMTNEWSRIKMTVDELLDKLRIGKISSKRSALH